MNSGWKVGFGVARGGRWLRRSVSKAAAMGLVTAGMLCGCESTDGQAGDLAKEVGGTALAAVSTSELKLRRATVLQRYAEIQRDVELKAGLPMGVAIADERALLGELYREAHEIERELMRRFTQGDPDVTIEQVRASF